MDSVKWRYARAVETEGIYADGAELRARNAPCVEEFPETKNGSQEPRGAIGIG